MKGAPASAKSRACCIMPSRPSRRDDAKLGPGLSTLFRCRIHFPRMEGGDLVVVQISGDEGLRRKSTGT